ncbi:hypothetical protein B0H13DRAFT_1967357 [Mycena leptocephala]|nr:hypothetical protein B0H13DRAFT_1967357 [Mycena leptocephala]
MANLVHSLANILMQDSLLSLEIIPGGIEPWLKILYQLYLSALEILHSESVTSQLDASSVIILANPAHQTALNVRKRLIQSGALSAHAELRFSARLLPSSRPCSKESIQWAHRRWIFNFLYPRGQSDFGSPVLGWTCGGPSEVPEIPPDAIENEFALISSCCETYPRNYHAWSHHHFVVQCIYVSLRGSHPADSPYLALFTAEFLKLRRWIETHVSDHSAIHQYCNIVSRLQALDLPQDQLVLWAKNRSLCQSTT